MKTQINQPIRLFDSSEYGQRALFTGAIVNPRDKLGKLGVTVHGAFNGLFYRVIKVEAPVIDINGKTTIQTLRLNRSSLVKFIKAQKKNIHATMSDEQLIASLNAVLADKALQSNQQGLKLRHAGRHNQRPLKSMRYALNDYVVGRFFSWLYQVTISSINWLKIRFLFAHKEKDYFEISEVLAKRRYKEAKENVPAYREYVKADKLRTKKSKKVFADIPITTKSDYIQQYASADWRLHVGGRYPAKQKVDTSTGTTGKPSVWVRGEQEVETVKKSLKIAGELDLGKRKVHYINAFALGPWATGMTAYEVMRHTGSVLASGPDVGKIIDELERVHQYEASRLRAVISALIKNNAALTAKRASLLEAGEQILNLLLDNKTLSMNKAFDSVIKDPILRKHQSQIMSALSQLNEEKKQIIIAGYPPFLKDVVDTANAEGYDFKKYHARGVVGGQAISEALRDKLVSSGYSQINSSYGASDLDINIGVETDFEMGLRKTLEKNEEIQFELFGHDKGLPMIFHYDPFNYHIESDDNDDLIFTCNRNDRSSPRLRYNLGDKGRVYAASDVVGILRKHGIFSLTPQVNLPLVFVWGRDSAVAYRGCKVSFTDLERAITNLDHGNIYNKRAFYSYHDAAGNEKFDILIELKNGVEIPEASIIADFSRNLLVEMGRLNQDLHSHLSIDNTVDLPQVRFFKKGCSPISDSSGHRKQVLVFKAKTLPANYALPSNNSSEHHLVTVVKDKPFVAEVQQSVTRKVLR